MKLPELEYLFCIERMQTYKKVQKNWLELCKENLNLSESFYREIYIFKTFLRNTGILLQKYTKDIYNDKEFLI